MTFVIFTVIVITLSLLNGIWMSLDGVHVIKRGKYIGPEKPGPWSAIFLKIKINPFSLGPLFVIFGGLWLINVILIIAAADIWWIYSLCLSVLTLWYIPIGTISSLAILYLEITQKSALGF